MRNFLLKSLVVLFVCLINLKVQAVNLIADINISPGNSTPNNLTVFYGKLYFSADDGINGNELWSYDGINSPTMVADIRTGSSSSFPYSLEVFNNQLYFSADDGINGFEMWTYDGINPPTMVADINPGSNGSGASNFKMFNGQLYFAANDGVNGGELWTYDGVTSPIMVADINSYIGSGSGPSYFTEFNGDLYFKATNGINGGELWTYDGINPPTMVADIRQGSNGSAINYLTVFNGQLYFSADNSGIGGSKIWTYDGVNAPSFLYTSLFKDPEYLTLFNGQLYFSAHTNNNGKELWTYDGINPPTMVADIAYSSGLSSWSSPKYLTEFNGQLYFQASSGYEGPELWTYDGINPPTMIIDLNVGSTFGVGSYPSSLTVFNNQLCFSANDGTTGSELWALTHPVETEIDTQIVCDSIRWIDNNLYMASSNTAGIYFINGGATNGNDSIVILDLTILNSSMSINTHSAPSPFTWIDGNTYTSNNNTATETLTNAASCDSVITLNLTIIDTVIQGTITTSLGNALQNSKVYLIKYYATQDSVFAMDSTTTDAVGFYEFPNTFQNAYVKAVPDVSNYPNEIPTYNISSVVFQNADAVYLSYPFSNTDFSTIAGVNPGGNGFIGGIVGNGAGKNSEVGELLPNISLVLMNASNDVVAQTYTDANGYFEFTNLAEESFSIWVDKAGILNNLAPEISLATDNNKDDLKFVLHKTYLENITSVGIENITLNNFSVFPNPTNRVITIQNTDVAKKYTVELYSILGEQVFSKTTKKQIFNVDLEKLQLSKGTYLVKIATEKATFVQKIIYR